MLEVCMLVLSGILIALGILFCFIPVLPGALCAYAGLLCLLPTHYAPPTWVFVIFGMLAVIASFADNVVSVVMAKKFSCSRSGIFGCIVGAVVGSLFFFPVGVLAGPFLGAFVGEYIAGRNLSKALRGGFGALLGFVTGVLLKLILCGCIAGFFIGVLFG